MRGQGRRCGRRRLPLRASRVLVLWELVMECVTGIGLCDWDLISGLCSSQASGIDVFFLEQAYGSCVEVSV